MRVQMKLAATRRTVAAVTFAMAATTAALGTDYDFMVAPRRWRLTRPPCGRAIRVG